MLSRPGTARWRRAQSTTSPPGRHPPGPARRRRDARRTPSSGAARRLAGQAGALAYAHDAVVRARGARHRELAAPTRTWPQAPRSCRNQPDLVLGGQRVDPRQQLVQPGQRAARIPGDERRHTAARASITFVLFDDLACDGLGHQSSRSGRSPRGTGRPDLPKPLGDHRVGSRHNDHATLQYSPI